MEHIKRTLEEADHILQCARLITEGAPFWMRADDTFASITIQGDVAELSWPEAESGYYNSCSIESQRVTFPAELLLMTVDQIGTWKIEQRAKYDAEQKEQKERNAREAAERQTALEIRTLAALKAKYEPPKP